MKTVANSITTGFFNEYLGKQRFNSLFWVLSQLERSAKNGERKNRREARQGKEPSFFLLPFVRRFFLLRSN